jgi:hypothetical protein
MLRHAQCFTEKNRRRNSLHKQEIQAPQTPVSSTNKTDRHDITEIFFLKLALVQKRIDTLVVFAIKCTSR